MRRLARRSALAALVALPASVAAGAVGPAGLPSADRAADARPSALRATAVGVGLREHRIALYRSRVRPGRLRFDMENLGEDPHDLRIVGPGTSSTVRATSAIVAPGARARLRVTLRRRGLYRVVCTLGDHAERGMVARLRVVRRP